MDVLIVRANMALHASLKMVWFSLKWLMQPASRKHLREEIILQRDLLHGSLSKRSSLRAVV